jgi:hypothetical protein
MSMSTGDVRRPSDQKLSRKATATGGAKDDVIDSDAPAKKTQPGSQGRPGARTAAKAATRTSAKPAAGPTPAKASGKAAAGGGKAAAGGGKAAAGGGKAAVAGGGKAAVGGGKAAVGGGKAAVAGGGKAAVAGGGKGRKPVKPVKVNPGRSWGPISMFAGAGLVALLIVGFGAWQVIKKANQPSWQDRAAGIEGIQNYKASNPDWFKVPAEGNHKKGVLQYPTSPPVGGIHNPYWQDCMGDVYTAEVPKEQATHSMEHGAVWIAYNPSLPKDQVAKLADKVNGKSFMLMSPYPGLDKPISLQAWGYQLKLDNANDKRIEQFIDALRQNTTQEPQAGCSGGITDTGKVPLNLTPPSPAADPAGGAGAPVDPAGGAGAPVDPAGGAGAPVDPAGGAGAGG